MEQLNMKAFHFLNVQNFTIFMLSRLFRKFKRYIYAYRLKLICAPANKKMRGVARGIRNHNPLNIEYNRRNQWEGQVGHDGRFVIFVSPVYGFRAGARVLRSYQRRNINTVHRIVHTFAPSHENNSDHYAKMVSQWSGFGLHQPLDVSRDDTTTRIIQAMARMEVGHQYPLKEVMKGVQLA
ncbi:virion protein [Photobacterium sp. MCCC 1A19761]|uniref:virion protein n=1 Tax=Photobacterium sp. MCCC 1A19761 TaxID=3115000 RepID=UPI00307DD4C2